MTRTGKDGVRARLGAVANGNGRADPEAVVAPKITPPPPGHSSAPEPPADVAFLPEDLASRPQACAGCRWFVRFVKQGGKQASEGQCRRYPPTVVQQIYRVQNGGAVVEATYVNATVYPTTRDTDNCGEHAARRVV